MTSLRETEGDALITDADSWMREQGIRNRARMTTMLVPITPP